MPILDSKNITDCCQELQDKWPLLKAAYEAKFPGWSLRLDYTHRTPEKQFELFKKGRAFNGDTKTWYIAEEDEVVTNRDGFTRLSMHNHYPALAFDVLVIDPHGKLNWDTSLDQWLCLPQLAEELNLINGGIWIRPVDYPHFEVKKTQAKLAK